MSFSDLQPKLANPVMVAIVIINALRNKAVQRELDLVGVSGSVAQTFPGKAVLDASTDDT